MLIEVTYEVGGRTWKTEYYYPTDVPAGKAMIWIEQDIQNWYCAMEKAGCPMSYSATYKINGVIRGVR